MSLMARPLGADQQKSGAASRQSPPVICLEICHLVTGHEDEAFDSKPWRASDDNLLAMAYRASTNAQVKNASANFVLRGI